MPVPGTLPLIGNLPALRDQLGLNGKILDIPPGYIGFMTATNALTLAMFAANKRAEKP